MRLSSFLLCALRRCLGGSFAVFLGVLSSDSFMWRHFLQAFDPIAWHIGPVPVSWYGVCFLAGAAASLGALRFFLRKRMRAECFGSGEYIDLALFLTGGAIVGARVGYALLYNPSFFAENPTALVSPIDIHTGEWVGIAGMSVHGGAAGVFGALVLFARVYRKPLWELADAVALSLPIAIFFGRLGNFLAGELFGRTSIVPWAVSFPRSGSLELRHPSPLYEAMGEGILLFGILLLLSRTKRMPGELCALALGFYGGIRFILEYFREPDSFLGFFWAGMTWGQILSLMLLMISGILFGWLRRHGNAIVSVRQ